LYARLGVREHFEDPGADGRIILRRLFRKWGVGGMDWFYLLQDRNRRPALVTVVLNLQLP